MRGLEKRKLPAQYLAPVKRRVNVLSPLSLFLFCSFPIILSFIYFCLNREQCVEYLTFLTTITSYSALLFYTFLLGLNLLEGRYHELDGIKHLMNSVHLYKDR